MLRLNARIGGSDSTPTTISPARDAAAFGQSWQRRTVGQHGPSGLSAVAGAASATSAAAGTHRGSERRVGVEIALGEDAECRQSSGAICAGRGAEALVPVKERLLLRVGRAGAPGRRLLLCARGAAWPECWSSSPVVTTALNTSAVTVLLIEVVAGLRAKQSGRELAVQILIAALLGRLIIALRLILH